MVTFVAIETRKGRRKRMESEERKAAPESEGEEGTDDVTKVPLPPTPNMGLPAQQPLPAIRPSVLNDTDSKPG